MSTPRRTPYAPAQKQEWCYSNQVSHKTSWHGRMTYLQTMDESIAAPILARRLDHLDAWVLNTGPLSGSMGD